MLNTRLTLKHKNKIISRNLMSSSRMYNIAKNSLYFPKNQSPMSVVIVRQPPLIGDSNHSYINNPICTKHKYNPDIKTFVKKPVRHYEIIQQCCIIPGCSYKVCYNLCAKALPNTAKAIAHVTHGEPENAVPFSNTDLANNKIKENIVIYNEGHEVTSIEGLHGEKTQNLQEASRLSKLAELLNPEKKD